MRNTSIRCHAGRAMGGAACLLWIGLFPWLFGKEHIAQVRHPGLSPESGGVRSGQRSRQAGGCG